MTKKKLIIRHADCCHCLGSNAFAAAGETEPFSGGRLDADSSLRQAQQGGNGLAHRRFMRSDPRRFANDGEVDMVDDAAATLDQRAGVLDKARRGHTAPLWVTGREVVADVAFTGRAEQRVGDRMQCDVRVAVADQSALMGDTHAAKPQVMAKAEGVDIEAQAGPADHLAGDPLLRLDQILFKRQLFQFFASRNADYL